MVKPNPKKNKILLSNTSFKNLRLKVYLGKAANKINTKVNAIAVYIKLLPTEAFTMFNSSRQSVFSVSIQVTSEIPENSL
jgi:hypothetical protein